MAADRPRSPWVAQHQRQVGFGLQVYPVDTPDKPIERMLAAGRLAEALGFDAFFFGDHPAWGPECWLHMATLATMTERIRLGPNVACVGYRHPVMLARLAADLDNLSGGRLLLGLGVGWDANEFANLGLPFPPARERQAMLDETIAILRGVWGSETFSYAGRHFQATNARVAPPPVQQPGPPIMIAGGGERGTLRQVAQYADACQLAAVEILGGEPVATGFQRKLGALRRHCDDLGRPFDAILRTHFTGWNILAEDRERLAAKIRRYFPEGIEARFSGPWRGFAVAMTAEEAVAHYRALAGAGFQYFIASTLDASDEETIRLLGEVVMPGVRG